MIVCFVFGLFARFDCSRFDFVRLSNSFAILPFLVLSIIDIDDDLQNDSNLSSPHY